MPPRSHQQQRRDWSIADSPELFEVPSDTHAARPPSHRKTRILTLRSRSGSPLGNASRAGQNSCLPAQSAWRWPPVCPLRISQLSWSRSTSASSNQFPGNHDRNPRNRAVRFRSISGFPSNRITWKEASGINLGRIEVSAASIDSSSTNAITFSSISRAPCQKFAAHRDS